MVAQVLGTWHASQLGMALNLEMARGNDVCFYPMSRGGPGVSADGVYPVSPGTTGEPWYNRGALVQQGAPA